MDVSKIILIKVSKNSMATAQAGAFLAKFTDQINFVQNYSIVFTCITI